MDKETLDLLDKMEKELPTDWIVTDPLNGEWFPSVWSGMVTMAYDTPYAEFIALLRNNARELIDLAKEHNDN